MCGSGNPVFRFWSWPKIAGLIFSDCLSGRDPVASDFFAPEFASPDEKAQVTRGQSAELGSRFERDEIIQLWLADIARYFSAGHLVSEKRDFALFRYVSQKLLVSNSHIIYSSWGNLSIAFCVVRS